MVEGFRSLPPQPLEFTARELDTQDEAEWDHICDRIETHLRAARDAVLRGEHVTTQVVIVVREDKAH